MRTKIMILGLICLFVFICCKKNLPTSTDLNASLTINHFTANPTDILAGGYSTLSWDVRNASNVVIEPDVGSVLLNSTIEVSPVETTVYTLIAHSGTESISRTAQVAVDRSLAAIEIIGEPELFFTCYDYESSLETFDFSLTIKNVSDRLIIGCVLKLVIYGEDSQGEWDYLVFHQWDMLTGAGMMPGNILPDEERLVTTLGWHPIPIGTAGGIDMCERMRDGDAEFSFEAYF